MKYVEMIVSSKRFDFSEVRTHGFGMLPFRYISINWSKESKMEEKRIGMKVYCYRVQLHLVRRCRCASKIGI